MSTTQDYINAMQQSFKASQAGQLNVTYQLQINGPGGGVWGISIKNGTCSISAGAPAKADVYLGMSSDDYLKLAAGQLNVVSAYRQGQLKVGGNVQLALKFTELFSPWAGRVKQTQPLEEPPAPPPQPAEPTPPATPPQPTLADYVEAMPQGLRTDSVRGVKVTYQFQLSGSGGGTWRISVANGQALVKTGGGTANLTIGMTGADFIKLAQGRLNTVQAYQQGRVQISGDPNLAAKITDFFAPWAGAVKSQAAPPATPTPPPAPPGGGPASGSIFSQLMNGGFNEYQPYIRPGEGPKVWKEDQFPEQIGRYWNLHVIHEDDRRIHPMSSQVFGHFTQKYFGGGGLNYKLEGPNSQVVCSRYGFDLVFHQTVKAQPGQNYTFTGKLVTYYRGTKPPPVHNKIFYRVGIDPTGGSDYSSTNVVWSERDGTDNEWRGPTITALAQAEAITVYIRLENTEKDVGSTDLNVIHLDDFKLD